MSTLTRPLQRDHDRSNKTVAMEKKKPKPALDPLLGKGPLKAAIGLYLKQSFANGQKSSQRHEFICSNSTVMSLKVVIPRFLSYC